MKISKMKTPTGKLIGAKAVVRGIRTELESRLSKVLTLKDLKIIGPEITMVVQALKILEVKIIMADPSLEKKLAKLE